MAFKAPSICSGCTASFHDIRSGSTDAIRQSARSHCPQFLRGGEHQLLRPTCNSARYVLETRVQFSNHEIGWPVSVGGTFDPVPLVPSLVKHYAVGRSRRTSGVMMSSGRYAASVLRGSGRKRIRRSKKVGVEEDSEAEDDQTDEPYSTLEDAPIYGSVHGDSFDYDSEDGAVSAEGKDSKGTRTGTKKESAPAEEAGQTNGALSQDSSKESASNGASQRTNGVTELPQDGVQGKESVETVKKHAVSGKAKTSGRPKVEIPSEGAAKVSGENGTAVKKKKKKRTDSEQSAEPSLKAESKGKGASVKKAASKTPKPKLTPAPKLKRSKAFNSRSEEAALDSIHATEAVSKNGAAEPTPNIDTAEDDERLQERLASSLQAESSASDTSYRSSGSLLFVVKSGCAYVVTSEALQRVESAESAGLLAESAEGVESAGTGVLGGAAILQAATSLVENLAESAQASGVVPEQITESVESAGESVSALVETVTDSVTTSVAETVDTVTTTVAETVDTVTSTVADTVDTVTSTVAETVDTVTSTVAETVGDVGGAVVGFMTEEEELGDTEFAAFSNQAGPQLRGRVGLENLRVLDSNESPFHLLSDAYSFSLKLPPFQFCLVILALPLLMSLLFTGVYMLDAKGLVPDDSVQQVFADLQKEGHVEELRWYMLFQVFMFSLSLATGLQPVLAPVTPYSFLAANLNALLAQLLFVFLSGSVFARLSQRSRPIRCSTVALICPPCHENRSGKEWSNKVLMARYVLVGSKPSELVDVKVDLTFCYNTVTRNGSYFMRQVSLKLVRSEVAHQKGGMLVRHVIDESSPLYRRTEEMLQKEDAVFKLSVVGLERSSMQSVFELQHYCAADGDVIFNAEFEDVVLVNKSMQRVIDQSKLSTWRSVPAKGYRTINA